MNNSKEIAKEVEKDETIDFSVTDALEALAKTH